MAAWTKTAELLAGDVSVDLTNRNRNSNLAAMGYVSEYLDTREISYLNSSDIVGSCQIADIPTIGRGAGHIARAHQPDGWIAQEQCDACDAFIRRLVDRVLA